MPLRKEGSLDSFSLVDTTQKRLLLTKKSTDCRFMVRSFCLMLPHELLLASADVEQLQLACKLLKALLMEKKDRLTESNEAPTLMSTKLYRRRALWIAISTSPTHGENCWI